DPVTDPVSEHDARYGMGLILEPSPGSPGQMRARRDSNPGAVALPDRRTVRQATGVSPRRLLRHPGDRRSRLRLGSAPARRPVRPGVHPRTVPRPYGWSRRPAYRSRGSAGTRTFGPIG